MPFLDEFLVCKALASLRLRATKLPKSRFSLVVVESNTAKKES